MMTSCSTCMPAPDLLTNSCYRWLGMLCVGRLLESTVSRESRHLCGKSQQQHMLLLLTQYCTSNLANGHRANTACAAAVHNGLDSHLWRWLLLSLLGQRGLLEEF